MIVNRKGILRVAAAAILCLFCVLASIAPAEDCDDSICVTSVYYEDTQETVIKIDNKQNYPVTVGFALKLDNMRRLKNGPSEFVVPPVSKLEVMRLLHVNKFKRAAHEYSYSWVKGDVNTKHDDEAVYQLPFDVGSTHYVGQSCEGEYTHNQAHSMYAVDFSMPEGTKIYAARDGTVIDLHEVSVSGGESSMHLDDANFVQVLHEDGTIGNYYHLRTMGVKAKIGDQVQRGALLGYSGNTGFSSGPHLHFSVQVPRSAQGSVSVPVNLKTARGMLSCPRIGLALKAVEVDS